MANSRKRLKTDYGSFATVADETSNDDYESALGKRKLVKSTTNDEKPPILSGSTTSLLDLNNDCLYEIFNRVSPMDWWAIAQSCTSIKELMLQLFAPKQKILKLNLSREISVETTVASRRLLQTFGSLIVDLAIDYSDTQNADAIMDAVIRYCCALESLNLKEFHIRNDQGTLVGMKKVFEKLQNLHLRDFYIPKFPIDFFNTCNQLVELQVAQSCDSSYEAIFRSSFQKLEHLIIVDSEMGAVNQQDIAEFISRHPKLKTFVLEQEYSHIPILANHCKDLQQLGFGFESDWDSDSESLEIPQSLESLEKFSNLKNLTCFFVGKNMANLVKQLPKLAKSLEVLDLSIGSGTSDLIRIISELKKLTVLRLDDIDAIDLNPLAKLSELTELSLDLQNEKKTTFDLVKIVNRLANLTELTFQVGDYKMPRNTYYQLLNIVESRPRFSRRELLIDCPTTDDFKDLLRATVKIVPRGHFYSNEGEKRPTHCTSLNW